MLVDNLFCIEKNQEITQCPLTIKWKINYGKLISEILYSNEDELITTTYIDM